MASFHISVKTGKRGSAANHASYIARQGKFGKNLHEPDLVAMEFGNMPEWALGNPSFFWKKADQNERVNGAAYREYEMALPTELTLEQQRELVDEFIQRSVCNKAYQLAIHSPKAAIGDAKQPHAHIMISDRVPDNIIRNPEQHFKRFNPVHPELGGCRKDSGGKTPEALKNDLKTFRANYAELQNEYLEKYGHTTRVDHRSNRERGIEKDLEKHFGASAIKNMTEEEKLEIKNMRQSNKKNT